MISHNTPTPKIKILESLEVTWISIQQYVVNQFLIKFMLQSFRVICVLQYMQSSEAKLTGQGEEIACGGVGPLAGLGLEPITACSYLISL